jgi:arylsulfatase A-like enzyme
MKKSNLPFFNILVILGFLIFTSCRESSKEENAIGLPNIVLLMGDDHGWDETGYNGHPHLHTPVLDQMAANGLRMDRFYSASPVCSPTRGSVITGRHPNRYGNFSAGWSIRPEEISIAQMQDYLGEQGFRKNTLLWYFGDNGTPREGNAPVPFRGEKVEVYEAGNGSNPCSKA